MNKYKATSDKFKTTYKNKEFNSLNFENHAETDDYVDPSISFGNVSVYGLKVYNVSIITKYLQELIDSSEIHVVDESKLSNYYMDPYLVSMELFGISDYWYIILAVNNYRSVESFKNFTQLLIPNRETIEAIINELEKN